MVNEIWESVTGTELMQGDYLPSCLVPIFNENFGSADAENSIELGEVDLITITQSCDLENEKTGTVALLGIYPIRLYEESNPSYKKKGRWEEVRKYREPSLHLLHSPDEPLVAEKLLVVDFRQIYSLPLPYIKKVAGDHSPRWRLKSPYLELFSQRFGNVFSRVGLPVPVPRLL